MGATKSGDVPVSSTDINESVVRSLAEKIAGPGTAVGRSMQSTPGGKELQKRFAGDINLPGFMGSKEEQAGISPSRYASKRINQATKGSRGTYLGQGANSLNMPEELGVTEEDETEE